MHFTDCLNHLPFFAMVAPAASPKLSAARITEAVIIAAISGMLASYMTVKDMTTRLDERFNANKQHYDYVLMDVKKSIDHINDKVDDHLMIVSERMKNRGGP